MSNLKRDNCELERGDIVKVKMIKPETRFIGCEENLADGEHFKYKTEVPVRDEIPPEKEGDEPEVRMEMVDANEPPADMLGQEGEIFRKVAYDFGFNGYAVRFHNAKLILPWEVAATLQGDQHHRCWLFEREELELVENAFDKAVKEAESKSKIVMP